MLCLGRDDITLTNKLEFSSHNGFPEFDHLDNVCRNWTEIWGKANSEIKETYDSLSVVLRPRDLLKLMRKDSDGKLQIVDIETEEDIEVSELCLEMDYENFRRHDSAFSRLNGLRIVVAKSHILRQKFQLQPQIMSLSCNGLPLDKPLDRHITSSPGYRAGIHLWMDVDETTGVGKQEVPRMSVYYQFMNSIWRPLLQIIKPFLGSPQQSTGADFEKFKKKIQPVIQDDDERRKYLSVFGRASRFSNEQDVVTGYAMLESDLDEKVRPIRIVTHDKTHFDFLQMNSSKYQDLYDGPIPKDFKPLTQGSDGIMNGEYKLYMYATSDGSSQALLSKKGNKHQSIDEIDIAVVGYLDLHHRKNPSNFEKRLLAINKILSEADPTVKVYSVNDDNVPKRIADAADSLVTHVIAKGPFENGKYSYLVVLSEHLD